MRILRRAEDVPKRTLWQRLKDVALTDVGVLVKGVDPGSIERLEELLLEADFGVPTTMRLVADVERLATRGEIRNQDEFMEALRAGVESALREGNSDPALAVAASGPTVVLVIGVNGAGKTSFGSGPIAPARTSSPGKREAIPPPWPSTRSTQASRAEWMSSSSTPPAGCTPATA